MIVTVAADGRGLTADAMQTQDRQDGHHECGTGIGVRLQVQSRGPNHCWLSSGNERGQDVRGWGAGMRKADASLGNAAEKSL